MGLAGRRGLVASACIGVVACLATPAWAGMRPSTSLTELAHFRLQTISFFVVFCLLLALIVRWAWNALARDFPRLPRLPYSKALLMVGLWGLLFMIVLAMISGARELMTPGAWETRADGGYRLATASDDNPYNRTTSDFLRQQQLERLREGLWTYAERHDRRLPVDEFDPGIPPGVWRTPHPSGISYIYLAGRTLDSGDQLLAYEPGVYGPRRLALRASGRIEWMLIDAIRGELYLEAPR